MLRKLPVGIQDFIKLREGGFIYVDKTALIHQMINGFGGVYFLSRPRRFGKSLLCSTLKAIFEGKREFFQEICGCGALAIDSLEWEWKKYPVILLSMNIGNYSSGIAILHSVISNAMSNIANNYDIVCRGETIYDQFTNLIYDLHKKYKERVVVIIDEYDKPLLDTVDNIDLHIQIRKELKAFYGIIKHSDEHIKMSFITGITKFSQVSIFSDLNHLTDISFYHEYADLCGITLKELEENFEPEILVAMKNSELNRDEYISKLCLFYDGYRFTEKEVRIFNPFGLLLHFNFKGKFAPYWYDTGSPSFLIQLIKDQKLNILDLKDMKIMEKSFSKFNIDNSDALAMLYHCGYLTISDYDKEREIFTLNYPNLEVKSAFSTALVEQYLQTPKTNSNALITTLPGAFIVADMDEALTCIKQYIASIPYDLIKDTENFYHTVLHIIFSMLGFKTLSEIRIAAGRIDTIVKTNTHIFCFEFKLDKPAKEALAQIDSKDYLLPFKKENKTLVKIGVSFSSAIRNIENWESCVEL